MNFKRYKKYLVISSEGRPMSYEKIGRDGGQFAFCGDQTCRQPLPAKTYTHKQATELIKKTVEWRNEQGYSDFANEEYLLMPVI